MSVQISKAERGRANLLRAIELGNLNPSIFEQLARVEADLVHLRAELETGRPRPVALPDNLPERFRAFVAGLERGISEETTVGRWSDELRLLVERIVVRHDAHEGHTMEIVGNLAEMLAGVYPAMAGSYRAEARSLKLVAGA
jgi:hypothetical protein